MSRESPRPPTGWRSPGGRDLHWPGCCAQLRPGRRLTRRSRPTFCIPKTASCGPQIAVSASGLATARGCGLDTTCRGNSKSLANLLCANAVPDGPRAETDACRICALLGKPARCKKVRTLRPPVENCRAVSPQETRCVQPRLIPRSTLRIRSPARAIGSGLGLALSQIPHRGRL